MRYCCTSLAMLVIGALALGSLDVTAPPKHSPVPEKLNPRVEDLVFEHRADTLRSGIFFNDRFASNRWKPGDPDPPPVPTSHYACFSERYINGDHESTKPFGMWQYAPIYTNNIAQGDYAAGQAAFLFHLRHTLASPGSWLAEDCARKSRNTVIQVSLMPLVLVRVIEYDDC